MHKVLGHKVPYAYQNPPPEKNMVCAPAERARTGPLLPICVLYCTSVWTHSIPPLPVSSIIFV